MTVLLTILAIALRLTIILIFIRILLSWLPGVNRQNAALQSLDRVINPMLTPFRRVMPKTGAVDLSPILAIVLLGALANVFDGLQIYSASHISVPIGLIIVDIIWQVLSVLIIITIIIVLVRVLFSLVRADPWHPVSVAIREMSEPMVQPFRAFVSRPTTSLDVAAVIAFVAYVIIYFLAREAFVMLAQSFSVIPLV